MVYGNVGIAIQKCYWLEIIAVNVERKKKLLLLENRCYSIIEIFLFCNISAHEKLILFFR